MKESISELQSAIRRARPHLLLPTATQQEDQSQWALGNTNNNNNANEVAARNELQLEAASELINAVATLVWKLDCLWNDHSLMHQEVQHNDNYRMAIEDEPVNDKNTRSIPSASTVLQHDEPHSEWNEDAKALIREGYGMISAVSQSPLLSIDDKNDHHSSNDDDQRQHTESMRSLARSSILELLTSVSTSACRHFLLAFLPHFTPLAMVNGKSFTATTSLDEGKVPLTKRANENQHSHLQVQSSEVISELLEAFQSLIQIDATTLVPLLSTLSHLFASASWEDEERYAGIDTKMSDDGADDDNTNNPREECFQICISSMSSISEHDFPSLLKSLFTLVRSEEEGRLAMKSVRRECNSAFGSATTTIPDPSILGLDPKVDGDVSISDHNISNNNHLVLFIGNVIIQALLSDELYGSKHLAKGFLDEVRHSLLTQAQRQTEAAQTSSTSDNGNSLTCLTTLDTIMMIALHSHAEYQSLVESIIESLTTDQALIFFGLVQPLIESWKPAKHNRNGTHQTSSLLYGSLSSSLISLLFYMLMVSTMTVPSKVGDSQFALVDGLLSFHFDEEMAIRAADTRECNMSYAVTCCRVISNLYSNIDPQKQQEVVNSLLSMVTDSFVRSSATSTIGKKGSVNDEEKGCMGSLLAASCAACRTILLISTKQTTNLSQIKGTVMDRLLLLASMSASISTQQLEGNSDDAIISYHLFDMNCAMIISLLQDNEQRRDSGSETSVPIVGNSGTELLILCQKFLFATDYLSSEGSNSNPEHRVICGIILASRLLRCKFILRSERGNIWNWMMSVITPAPTTNAPIQALNPVIAQWGLSFLSFASASIAKNSFYPEMTEFVDANPVCGHSDVFNQVNKMLATAAVIQMENSLRIPQHHKSSHERSTFLAFSNVPQKKNASEANNMVISSPYFLYGKKCEDPDESKRSLSAIDQVADYIYHLVDRYLELGRIRSSGVISSKSSWNPRGWLLTKIQLPCCLSQPTMEVLGMKDNSLELEDEPNSYAHVDPESWKLLFSPDVSKAAIVRSLIEFLSCIVISISVSNAVLKHAHDHFSQEQVQLSEMGGNDSDDVLKRRKKKQKQIDALKKLLQFHVNKVMSMQRISRNIYQLLNALYLAACKQRLSGGPEKAPSTRSHDNFVDRRRIPLADIQSSITAVKSFLNSRMNKFDSSILWGCILDDVDDAFILETMMKAAGMDEQLLLKQQQIFHFRVQVLHNLQHYFTSNSNQKRIHGQALGNITPATFDDLSLLGISRVFQLLISLTPCLRNFTASTSEEGRLYLTAMYKILLAAFSFAARNKRVGPTMIDKSLIDVVPRRRRRKNIKLDSSNDRNLQLDILMQKCATTKNAVDNNVVPTVPNVNTAVVKLKEGLLQQLKTCDDASISCYVMDLISILVVSEDSTCGAMADITWKNIHTVYHISSSSVTHLPYMMFEIHHIISDVTENEHCDAERAAVVKDTFSRLLRFSNTLSKTKDLHAKAFYHNLLAHYSSLLIENVSQSQCLTEIFAALEGTIALSNQSKSLPGLNEKNFPAVFELLMHMTTVSFSLAKPYSSKKHCPLNADKQLGPYCEIMWPIEMFGKLLFLAQTRSFPRRVLFNVVKHSLLMIKLCEYQLQYCVDWRNSQKVSMVTTGSQDYAAVGMLQPLIDKIASVCTNDATSFCRTIRKELSASNFKNTKSIAELIFRIQGIEETLKSICQSQSLTLPQRTASSDAVTSNKRGIADDPAHDKKRRRSLFQQKSNNSRPSFSTSILEQLPTEASERPHMLKHFSESEDSGSSSNDSFAESDDDSFGAIGDWAA